MNLLKPHCFLWVEETSKLSRKLVSCCMASWSCCNKAFTTLCNETMIISSTKIFFHSAKYFTTFCAGYHTKIRRALLDQPSGPSPPTSCLTQDVGGASSTPWCPSVLRLSTFMTAKDLSEWKWDCSIRSPKVSANLCVLLWDSNHNLKGMNLLLESQKFNASNIHPQWVVSSPMLSFYHHNLFGHLKVY